MKENAEAPDGGVKGPPSRWRGGRAAPGKYPFGAHVLIAVRFGVCYETPQDLVLIVEL
jgi:hypothetical protein